MITSISSTARAPVCRSDASQFAHLAHAPYPATDTWCWDAWCAITPADARSFESEVGRPPACETRAAIARHVRDEGGR